MGIETSRKGKDSRDSEKEKKPYPSPKPSPNARGKKARRGQQKKGAASPVQKLVDTCKEVFSSVAPGVVPPTDQIEKLTAVLDAIKLEDVGLSPGMQYFCPPKAGITPAIRYIRLYECNRFEIAIFCFPPSGVIPLHNHPGMTVFSKLLFGKMHIKSYDWAAENPPEDSADPSQDDQGPEKNQPGALEPEAQVRQPERKLHVPLRLAKVKVDSDFTAPCGPKILYPEDGGNMHRFTAITACAVLDVLGPPYSSPEGRHCTYYYDLPYERISICGGAVVAEEEKASHAWLLEKGRHSEEFEVVPGSYKGPKIKG